MYSIREAVAPYGIYVEKIECDNQCYVAPD